MRIRAAAALLLLIIVPAPVFGQAPVAYRLTFPEPEHRWMQGGVSFADLPSDPLELAMSRPLAGPYGVPGFWKNVVDLEVADSAGATLTVPQIAPHQW